MDFIRKTRAGSSAGLPGFVPCTPCRCDRIAQAQRDRLVRQARGRDRPQQYRRKADVPAAAPRALHRHDLSFADRRPGRDRRHAPTSSWRRSVALAWSRPILSSPAPRSSTSGSTAWKMRRPCAISLAMTNGASPRWPRRGSTLAGDVHPLGARGKAGWLTPVPGGVGPLTIAMLLRNTLDAARRSAGLE